MALLFSSSKFIPPLSLFPVFSTPREGRAGWEQWEINQASGQTVAFSSGVLGHATCPLWTAAVRLQSQGVRVG